MRWNSIIESLLMTFFFGLAVFITIHYGIPHQEKKHPLNRTCRDFECCYTKEELIEIKKLKMIEVSKRNITFEKN